MIQKSITTGVIIGLLLTLAAVYPTFAVFVSRVVSMDSPFGEIRLMGSFELPVSLLVMMACAGAVTLIYLTLGSVAALRVRATDFGRGTYAGGISGVVAGLTLYIALVSPTAAMMAGQMVLTSELPAGTNEYAAGLVLPFARNVFIGGFSNLLATLAASLVVGSVEGGIVGWLRRNRHPSAQPAPQDASLLDVLGDKRGERRWFAAHDDAVLRAGLLAGIAGGLVLTLFEFLNLLTAMSSDPTQLWMASVIKQALAGTRLQDLAQTALPVWLGPLTFVVTIGVGGLAALLPHNPPSRLRSRIYAALVAGATLGLIVSLPFADSLRFLIGLLPQFAASAQRPDLLRTMLAAFTSTPGRVLLIYILPLPVVALLAAVLAAWGALQGIFYGVVLSLFRLRPVDRASLLWRDMASHPDQFLPYLYRTFQADKRAVETLEHLAFDLQADPVQARVVAAYHTLAARPARAAESLDVIAQSLSERPGWRLRSEIGALHQMLSKGLRATTVAQMATIMPIPEDQTTALPPLLAKSGSHLTRILNELKKVERVDDVGSQLIFLNNALENVRLAQLYIQEGVTSLTMCCTPFPELGAMSVLLGQWEALISSAIKERQGRAELTCELVTRKLTFAPRLALTIALANRGLNVAQEIRLRVSRSDEYDLLEGQEQTCDILPSEERREFAFTVKPHNAGRLRVSWNVTYDDALNDDRTLEFGDLVEFVEAEKPFQRIFPIPYVTGTPLQTSHTFVGRQDVFDFVHEHLLGTYQNNVIVLHGQRRTGKTSILYRLNEVLAQTHRCVLIDMQGKAARGEVEFLYSMADDIAYALDHSGVTVELPPRQEFEPSPEFFFRSRFLRSVYDALGTKNLLLMFDEFEELQKRVEDGKLTADIFPYLRNLMQHERKVDFIFAGTHKLEELAAEYWSILFNIAAYKKISFLTADEVARLVTEPVAPFGLEYDPLAIERIYQVAAGHPYFTQLICHEMVVHHNETRRSYLTTTDVDAVLDRIVEQGEAHFKYIWAESGTQRRLVLLALAELLETKDAVTLDDVAELLRKRGRPLDERELPQALDDLEARDIVMRSGPRSSLYHFRVDLVRRWIYAARPAYEKVV